MFLGSRGITIPKTSEQQQKQIKRELTFIPKSDYQPLPPFYVYRESPNKLYVPRFYGQFDVPSRLPEGVEIDVPFCGSLRDSQIPAIEAYLKVNCGLLELPCGFGKTIIALYIVSKLRRKTLIIVHKEFLLDQWIERINEFLPSARIGRIQGTTIDVTNKDIVIGMLQSLSMKTYAKETFQEFGFTIIDETHHIAAEVFCNALFQIVTPYMLGLSATMERKDGLSKIFKLFLGEVVYSAQRERVDNVIIDKAQFTFNDDEFNETILNFKGQANYTCMIKKLCEFNPRKEFILTKLTEAMKDPNRQLMILSHTKALLQYFYEAIQHRNIGTVGYYVGGMKQEALKETEKKRIILATYAMAEEALDIKTLSALILATPKTDVTQAVGRILRVKHDNPLVIDIVDPHPTFQRQWQKRQTFYKKQGYVVLNEKKSKCLLTV